MRCVSWHTSVASLDSNKEESKCAGVTCSDSKKEEWVKESTHTSGLKLARMHLKWNWRKHLTVLCVVQHCSVYLALNLTVEAVCVRVKLPQRIEHLKDIIYLMVKWYQWSFLRFNKISIGNVTCDIQWILYVLMFEPSLVQSHMLRLNCCWSE